MGTSLYVLYCVVKFLLSYYIHGDECVCMCLCSNHYYCSSKHLETSDVSKCVYSVDLQLTILLGYTRPTTSDLQLS